MVTYIIGQKLTLLDREPNPSLSQIKKAIRGNVCRCTGYQKIIQAIALAGAILRGEASVDPSLEAGARFGVGDGAFRADVRETLTTEDIQSLALNQLDGAGVYKQIEKSMTTGQSSDGEDYGVAVLYCEFSEKDVLFRLAFDPDMALIGMDIQQP